MAPPDRRGHAVTSELNLFGDAERIVDLDPEITNGALKLRMPQQQLDRSQIAGLAIDLGGLRASHRMRAVGRAIEPGILNPDVNNPRVLPRREVWLPATAAGEQTGNRYVPLLLPAASLGWRIVSAR